MKQRARAGPAHGWMAHGWMEQASSGIKSQENTQGQSLYSFSGDIASRSSETGQLPRSKPVAEHGPALGSSLPHVDSPVALLIR